MSSNIFIQAPSFSEAQNITAMPDFATIKSKIADLKAKIENDSISPLYIGTILDELLD